MNVMSAIKRIYVIMLNNEDKYDIDIFLLFFALCLILQYFFNSYISFFNVFMRLVLFVLFYIFLFLYFQKPFVKRFIYPILFYPILSYLYTTLFYIAFTRDLHRIRLSYESENYVKNNFRLSSNYFKINY